MENSDFQTILDQKNKALFLDRDGVININKGYTCKIKDIEYCDGIFNLCQVMQDLNYKLIIITNQSGIGRKKFTETEFSTLSLAMNKKFLKHNIELSAIYYCPHLPEAECSCRKPKPGLIFEAQFKYDLDLEQSWFIGDSISDMEAAYNAGVAGRILINNSENDITSKNTTEIQEVFLDDNNIKDTQYSTHKVNHLNDILDIITK